MIKTRLIQWERNLNLFLIGTGILHKNYFGAITYDDIFSSWDYGISTNLIPKETRGFIWITGRLLLKLPQ